MSHAHQHPPPDQALAEHPADYSDPELKAYTELLQESREEAVERMVKQAQAIGANAVLNVRFATSSITQGAAELFAYGTAVVLE